MSEDDDERIRRELWGGGHQEGSCYLWDGPKTRGYGATSLRGPREYVHRIAWELDNGPIAEGMHIDHICGNPAYFRPDHLRPATNQQNAQARHKPRAGSTTGVRGVHRYKEDPSRNRSKPWLATWRENGKNRNKCFETRDEAELYVIQQRLRVYDFKQQADLDRLAELEGKLLNMLEIA